MTKSERGKRKILQGIVTSDKMDKTIVVKATRFFKHSLYKKYIHRAKQYKAHDEKNECRIGDVVQIIESRPISKDKKWRLKSVVERAKL